MYDDLIVLGTVLVALILGYSVCRRDNGTAQWPARESLRFREERDNALRQAAAIAQAQRAQADIHNYEARRAKEMIRAKQNMLNEQLHAKYLQDQRGAQALAQRAAEVRGRLALASLSSRHLPHPTSAMHNFPYRRKRTRRARRRWRTSGRSWSATR